jgi:hypothetical protein
MTSPPEASTPLVLVVLALFIAVLTTWGHILSDIFQSVR